MAFLYLDSCGDHYSTPHLIRRWPASSLGVAVDVQNGRTGNCIWVPNGGTLARRIENLSSPAVNPGTLGFWWMTPQSPVGIVNVCKLWHYGGPLTGELKYNWNFGRFEIHGSGPHVDDPNQHVESGPLAYITHSITAGVYYAIEFEYFGWFNASYRLKVNGVELVDVSGGGGPVANQTSIAFGPGGFFIDDVYVYNEEIPDLPGLGRAVSDNFGANWSVGVLRPTSPVAQYNNWVKNPDDPGIERWQYVSDANPDDATSYLSSAINDDRQVWNVEDVPLPVDRILAAQNVLSLNHGGDFPNFRHEIYMPNGVGGGPSDNYSHQIDTENSDPADPFPVPQIWGYWPWIVDRDPDGPLFTELLRSQFNTWQWGLQHRDNLNLDITQAVVEVLTPTQAVPPDPPDPPEQPAIELPTVQSHKFTTLWKIERTDGVSYHFTDHNMNLDFEGNTYSPVDSLSTSAHHRAAGLETDNYEARGIIDDAAISFDDLRAGRFREAQVTEYLIDWLYPWAGAIQKSVHWIESLSFNGEIWKAELGGLTSKLKRPIGDVYGRTCRHLLGDGLCKVNLEELTVFALTVTQSLDSATRFIDEFLPVGIDPLGNDRSAEGYWDYGTVLWSINTPNVGLSSEIRTADPGTGEVVLQIPMPNKIIASDIYNITPGCDWLIGTCQKKFKNETNFGGFPTIPGPNRTLIAPSSDSGIGLGRILGFLRGIS